MIDPNENPNENPTFETALAEVEQIVTQMEAGQMTLEESLTAYRRGAELLNVCQNALANAQQQVQILEGEMLKKLNPPAAPNESK